MTEDWSYDWHPYDQKKLQAMADNTAPEEQGVFAIRQFRGEWVYVNASMNIRRALSRDLSINEALCIFLKGHSGLEYSFELRPARESESRVQGLIKGYKPICNLELAGKL